ncbi:MAG: methyltransferase domain-containing protein [bacterium]|nr:methyltransferase domain-containing protein [bacterium]
MPGLPYNDERGEERQASWYASHRKEIYRTIGLRNFGRVLEVGCGTGVIAEELAARVGGLAVGVEIVPGRAADAERLRGNARIVAGDGQHLPFADNSFDAVFFAFSLMWINEPRQALEEAKRMVNEDGWVVALAEPDYDGLIDYPPEASSKEAVIAAIWEMGGNSDAGRRLREWFASTGFREFACGLIPHRSTTADLLADEESETAGLKRLLGDDISGKELRRIERERRRALEAGRRTYYLPVFYMAGRG